MERALPYTIAAGIIAFGVCILIAGLGSRTSTLWESVALIPIAVGLLSALSDC